LGEEQIRQAIHKQAEYVRWAFRRVAELEEAPSIVQE
jgi:hypothetical protein